MRPGSMRPPAPPTVTARITVPEAEPVEVPLRNVVGKLPGTDLADEHVLVTAHYDHVGVRPIRGDGNRHCAGRRRRL